MLHAVFMHVSRVSQNARAVSDSQYKSQQAQFLRSQYSCRFHDSKNGSTTRVSGSRNAKPVLVRLRKPSNHAGSRDLSQNPHEQRASELSIHARFTNQRRKPRAGAGSTAQYSCGFAGSMLEPQYSCGFPES